MINKKAIAGLMLAGTLAVTGTGAVYAAPGPECQNTQNTDLKLKKQELHKQFKNALDNLVKDGTLTYAQKDAILKAMAAKHDKLEKERIDKEKLEKGKNDMGTKNNGNPDKETRNPAEGKDARFKPDGRHGHHGFLRDLVKDGTLTQEQAEAVRKAFISARENVIKGQ